MTNAPIPCVAPRPWPRYLRGLLAALLLTLLATAAFNVAVDPLDVFGTPRVKGFNALKPHLDHHRELTRWRQAARHCPGAVILGNSRAEIGFDPEHPAFAARGLVAVNQAVPGTATDTALSQLHWLKAAGCMPKLAVLGVEYFDFLGAEHALAGPLIQPGPAPRIDAPFLAEAVFSLSGLGDSFTTLALQRSAHPATLTDKGFNPLFNYDAEVARSGHYVLFRQRALENTRNWARKAAARQPSAGQRLPAQAQELKAVVELARASGMELHLVIYPYHAQVRLIMDSLGLTTPFNAWKQQVLGLAGEPVRLWDFSGLHPETLEAIPAPSDRKTRLRNYWEGGHFKKSLGDHMLSRMLGGAEGDFGRRLDTASLQALAAADQAALLRLQTETSPLRDDVQQVLAQALVRRAGSPAATASGPAR